MQNVIFGLFIGIIIVSLVSPLIYLYGFTKEIFTILLYIIPLTGGITGFFIDKFSFVNIGPNEPRNKVEMDNVFNKINGSNTIITTKDGAVYKGIVNHCNSEMIILRNVSRIDLPEHQSIDKIFINKNEIKEIKTEKNQIQYT
jgi:small nuclear ribonucleoprotein (snRNP)-like protein